MYAVFLLRNKLTDSYEVLTSRRAESESFSWKCETYEEDCEIVEALYTTIEKRFYEGALTARLFCLREMVKEHQSFLATVPFAVRNEIQGINAEIEAIEMKGIARYARRLLSLGGDVTDELALLCINFADKL